MYQYQSHPLSGNCLCDTVRKTDLHQNGLDYSNKQERFHPLPHLPFKPLIKIFESHKLPVPCYSTRCSTLQRLISMKNKTPLVASQPFKALYTVFLRPHSTLPSALLPPQVHPPLIATQEIMDLQGSLDEPAHQTLLRLREPDRNHHPTRSRRRYGEGALLPNRSRSRRALPRPLGRFRDPTRTGGRHLASETLRPRRGPGQE